jgi:hypothetical protein
MVFDPGLKSVALTTQSLSLYSGSFECFTFTTHTRHSRHIRCRSEEFFSLGCEPIAQIEARLAELFTGASGHNYISTPKLFCLLENSAVTQSTPVAYASGVGIVHLNEDYYHCTYAIAFHVATASG